MLGYFPRRKKKEEKKEVKNKNILIIGSLYICYFFLVFTSINIYLLDIIPPTNTLYITFIYAHSSALFFFTLFKYN